MYKLDFGLFGTYKISRLITLGNKSTNFAPNNYNSKIPRAGIILKNKTIVYVLTKVTNLQCHKIIILNIRSHKYK